MKRCISRDIARVLCSLSFVASSLNPTLSFADISHSADNAEAQVPASPEKREQPLESFWKDLTSPVTTNAKWVFLSGTALALSLALLEDHIDDPLQTEVNEHRPLGNAATNLGHLAGSLAPNFAYGLAMLGDGWFTGNTSARDKGNLMLRATFYAQSVTTVLKPIIREPRPDRPDEKVSFPSGHATSAFSFASVIGAQHEWYYGLLAYTYATLVAYGRMNDNRHYFRDVIGGATIGASYGLGLYYRVHRDRSGEASKGASESTAQGYFNILPADDLSGAFVTYSGRF